MPKPPSLLEGRRTAPLSDDDVRRVINTFLSLGGDKLNVQYEAGKNTCFRVRLEETQEVPEIIFSSDIYPSANTISPNASLSMECAVAHEMCHFHRWKNKMEVHNLDFVELDEALTSLEAITRFTDLDPNDVRQLVSDSMQRIAMYLARKAIE